MQANVDQPTAGIRVLLTGSAADSLARTLAGVPALSVIRRSEDGAAATSTDADVAVHVVESSSAPGLIAEIERLRRLEDAPVILAAYGEPNGIVETGFAVGAADVLVLPQSAETLLFAIRKAARATAERPTGRLVTVFSPKGGSGKTVVATNLAVSAARAGLRSLLIDLDLQFGDSALSLAVTPRATIADLAVSASEVNVERLRAFVSVDPRTRVAVLPAPLRPEDATSSARPSSQPCWSRRVARTTRSWSTQARSSTAPCRSRRARPHRPPAAHLQSRGDLTQERPHRAGDDRAPGLRP